MTNTAVVDGQFKEIWECEGPPSGTFRVLRDHWDYSGPGLPVRTVYEIEQEPATS